MPSLVTITRRQTEEEGTRLFILMRVSTGQGPGVFLKGPVSVPEGFADLKDSVTDSGKFVSLSGVSQAH